MPRKRNRTRSRWVLKDQTLRKLGTHSAGVLLEGPPGTGKNLACRLLLEKQEFLSSVSQFWFCRNVCWGRSKPSSFFVWRCYLPAVIFIDEIDAVGRQLELDSAVVILRQRRPLISCLIEMDGLKVMKEFIIIAATNLPGPMPLMLVALTEKSLDRPSWSKGREAILRVRRINHWLKMLIWELVAQQTPGFVGVDLENVLNRAALVACVISKVIDADDIDDWRRVIRTF